MPPRSAAPPRTPAAPPRTAAALRTPSPCGGASLRSPRSGAPRMPPRSAAPPRTPAAPPRTAAALRTPSPFHALAPHARLHDPQHFRVHPQRLLVPLLLFVHQRHLAERSRAVHALAPRARRLDLQRLRVQPQRLLVPLLLLVHERSVVQRVPALHALAPHACLLDLQRLREHTQRLRVPLLLYVHPSPRTPGAPSRTAGSLGAPSLFGGAPPRAPSPAIPSVTTPGRPCCTLEHQQSARYARQSAFPTRGPRGGRACPGLPSPCLPAKGTGTRGCVCLVADRRRPCVPPRRTHARLLYCLATHRGRGRPEAARRGAAGRSALACRARGKESWACGREETLAGAGAAARLGLSGPPLNAAVRRLFESGSDGGPHQIQIRARPPPHRSKRRRPPRPESYLHLHHDDVDVGRSSS
eukprot:scaffold702_cov387-Prasinococcus_capsulatus_cf.AAC.5